MGKVGSDVQVLQVSNQIRNFFATFFSYAPNDFPSAIKATCDLSSHLETNL
jgi:hypothetical protein